MRFILVALLLSLALAGCTQSDDTVNFDVYSTCTIVAGNSFNDSIKSADKFDAFWQNWCDGSPPDVDFGKHVVVFDGMGRQTTSGYNTWPESATLDGDTLRVHFARIAPGDGCYTAQVESYPTAIAVVKATAKQVVITHSTTATPC